MKIRARVAGASDNWNSTVTVVVHLSLRWKACSWMCTFPSKGLKLDGSPHCNDETLWVSAAPPDLCQSGNSAPHPLAESTAFFPDGFWIIQFSLAVCMSVPPAMATNYQNDCKQDPSPFPWAAMEAWWLDQPTETVDHWTSQTMTGQILETSACQRVGTVLALFNSLGIARMSPEDVANA